MPHITVKLFAGRDDAKKQELARALREAAVTVLGCEAGHISVAAEDWQPADWHTVYDNEIVGNPGLLLAPDYQPGDELKTP